MLHAAENPLDHLVHAARERCAFPAAGVALDAQAVRRGGQTRQADAVIVFHFAVGPERLTPSEDQMVAVDANVQTGRGLVRIQQSPQLRLRQLHGHLHQRASVGTLYIQKASPWENGYVESFNGRLRDGLLNGELFLSLAEARYVLDEWQLEYNHRRPHSGIGWQTPAAFAAALEGNPVEAFSAATPAGPSVGAPPLPPAQPANQQLILS